MVIPTDSLTWMSMFIGYANVSDKVKYKTNMNQNFFLTALNHYNEVEDFCLFVCFY